MNIFPAIDLYGGKAVRLFKGEYDKMTVYSDFPLEVARDFEKKGASYIHMVDLEGAKSGTTPNFDTVIKIARETSLFTEIGGGIRSMETAAKYLEGGVDRVILGTSAVSDESFLKAAAKKYGERIAVGADIKDGFVAVKGWTEKSRYGCFDFFEKMNALGIKDRHMHRCFKRWRHERHKPRPLCRAQQKIQYEHRSLRRNFKS